jgi:molybdopterin-synthase adenylyltransferase
MDINQNDSLVLDSDVLQIPRYLLFRGCSKANSQYILNLGANVSYFQLKLGPEAFKIYLNFVDPKTPHQVAAESDISLQDVISACQIFFNQKLLYKYKPAPKEFNRYDRNLLYYSLNGIEPTHAQKQLSQIEISLIGMGGIGNWMSLNLIGLGLKKLKLVDHDFIEQSNLCRQVLFSESDVGRKKVQIAKEILECKNSSTVIEAVDTEVSEDNIEKLVQGSDFVVLSADSPPYLIQKWVNQACIRQNIPFFNVGYSEGTGIIGPLVVPHQTACLACDHFLENSLTSRSSQFIEDLQIDLTRLIRHYQAPSFTCLNSLVSCIAAYEIVKYFLNFGQCETIGQRLLIDPLNLEINKRKYDLNRGCKTCQQQ